jgi:hypothetical protein
MKLLKKLLILLLALSIGGLFAEGAYFGYGLGLQFDLGQLGSTITKDGLDNRNGTQKIIIPENTIDVYHRSGLVSRETKGAMSGLMINLFYERDLTDFFYRVEGAYTRKIIGGHTKAQLAGYTFIDQNWDFYSIVVPLYLGIKANVSESSSVYGALGINYFRGGWSLHGTNDGATPCLISSGILCGLGANGFGVFGTDLSIIPFVLSNPTLLYSGAIFSEQVVFDVSGIGFNFMIGIDKKLQSGNKFYFELEYLLDAKMDNAPVRSLGTITQLASTGNISYPIVVGGLRYKFGFKQPL